MIALQNFKDARARVQDIIAKTEFSFAPKLSEIAQCSVFLKKENLQKTGAYKIRGAFNKISRLSEAEKQNGVIAASAGNHAQGVAFSAKHFAIRCVIVMPEATPLLKVKNTQDMGAEVILAGENYDDAYNHALKLAKEQNLAFIHPFADDDIIAGQGTIALEIAEEQDLDFVIVPVGGGGLISGISSVYKNISPKTKIIGVVAQRAKAMFDSFHKNAICNAKSVHTIADGIAVRDVNAKNFALIKECVDDIVMVDDEEIANAVLFLLEKQKLVVEGAGAAGVAAILHHKIAPKQNEKVGIILSGGNVDVTMLSLIIEKGLIKAHRKMQFKTVLIDKPGSLEKLTAILCKAEANIIKIDYNRISTTIDYGDAIITMTLETKGREHQNEVRESLKKAGYKIDEFY
ncbi:threonine ammonia-lyase [Helicobacter sp. 23-1045]